MEVTGCGDGCDGVWVSKFWTCGIVYVIVRFFNSVSTCISEQVFSNLEGMRLDYK